MKKMLALVLFAAVSAYAAPWRNDITGERWPSRPQSIIYAGADWDNPSDEILAAAGARESTPAEVAVDEAAAAQAAQEAYAARVMAVAQDAAVFRILYEYHFGAGAVTNRAITEDAVAAYFVQRRIAKLQGATNDISSDGQDIIALNRGFEKIKEVTGDGTIWTFPWAMMP